MTQPVEELVFAPLGGLGEIGMNAALYGFGPRKNRQWILVDLGVSFAQADTTPGIDLVYPDLQFLHSIRNNLLGLVVTHAHEDHIGAIAQLWPQVSVPVYGTRFSLGLLEARRLSEFNAPKIPLREVKQGGVLTLGPFSIEFVPVSHSIPEANALCIRTPAGTVLHTGDWKLDATPVVGRATDVERLKAIGDEGVLALVCDSTNVVRAGSSPSEADVSHTLKDLIAGASNRVCVTAFASNVARIRSVAEAAAACGREVVVVGRGMDRVIQVADECGYLSGLPPFRAPDALARLPRNKVVALLTGSQGEPRAAMSRIARDDHPALKISPGDRVIFSSRTIPGNERAVGEIINRLMLKDVEVLTDRDHLVHVSGHPRRGELEQLYGWIRPKIAIPAHGEPLHLTEHAAFARAQGVPTVIRALNGDVVAIAEGGAGVVGKIPSGVQYKDGDIVVPATEPAIAERRRLSFAGVVSVAIAVDDGGNVIGEAEVQIAGVPAKSPQGEELAGLIGEIVDETIDNFPPRKRRDSGAFASAVERAVRNELRNIWGKKPICHVMIVGV
ncbi:ribonuclease J [Camelimonas fluminis]|uniref:Ribonuclease J n=1 Tax=Camelimonas fluminis TaxID=1576911 RepID=A0ABV7UJE1_9HYPH|nr:ribonuclease J [Camelimonas fluminis]